MLRTQLYLEPLDAHGPTYIQRLWTQLCLPFCFKVVFDGKISWDVIIELKIVKEMLM